VEVARPRPLTPAGVAQLVAEHVAAVRLEHPVRVAVDGPSWSGLDLAPLIADALVSWSRPVVAVYAADFLRPASVRLERGHDDPDAFYDDWVDLAALDREVLGPCGPGGSRRVLPTLWDTARDRATRAGYVVVPQSGVVVVTGWLLLGRGLPFDLTVHLAVSPAARLRRVPVAAAERELPAFARYDAQTRPAQTADIVVLADDPRRPAVIDRALPGTR
jgi:hypothetical protein